MKTLEQYLRENAAKGVIDHVIRAQVDADGWVSFYIHAQGHDSDTLDFDVNDNQLFAAQIKQPDGTYIVRHGSRADAEDGVNNDDVCGAAVERAKVGDIVKLNLEHLYKAKYQPDAVSILGDGEYEVDYVNLSGDGVIVYKGDEKVFLHHDWYTIVKHSKADAEDGDV